MCIEQIDIRERRPFCGGERFGDGPCYERIDGLDHYTVDPEDPANTPIVDLKNAKRASDGLVRFSGDFTILAPEGGGNGAALLDVPNRGHRVAPRMFNMAPVVDDDRVIEAGDGFLLRPDWTLAFCGWQWDVPAGVGRLGLRPPLVANPAAGRMQLRLQVGADQCELLLTDQHVGVGSNHETIPPAVVDDPEAELQTARCHGDLELFGHVAPPSVFAGSGVRPFLSARPAFPLEIPLEQPQRGR